jgi:uncharacterized OB-fold protein
MTEMTVPRLWCRSCGTVFTPPDGCDCDAIDQPELRDAVPYTEAETDVEQS